MSTLPTRDVGLGKKPALLIIDATQGFTDPRSPLGCDGSLALAQIALLLAVFRNCRLPIFFTTNAYGDACEASVFLEKLPALNELAANSHWAEIASQVAPLQGEPVLRKGVPSAFFDSPLRTWLSSEQVDSAVLCGFTTSGCVRASAVDALQCNLRVTVAADACGDRDPIAHDYNLRDLELKTGDVRLTSEIIERLRRSFLPI